MQCTVQSYVTERNRNAINDIRQIVKELLSDYNSLHLCRCLKTERIYILFYLLMPSVVFRKVNNVFLTLVIFVLCIMKEDLESAARNCAWFGIGVRNVNKVRRRYRVIIFARIPNVSLGLFRRATRTVSGAVSSALHPVCPRVSRQS